MGAQLMTVPLAILRTLGVKPSDLLPIATNLNTLTGAPVELVGGLLLEFRGINTNIGRQCTSRQLAYVSNTVPYTFLSHEACVDLGFVPHDFPTIGVCNPCHTLAASTCSN